MFSLAVKVGNENQFPSEFVPSRQRPPPPLSHPPDTRCKHAQHYGHLVAQGMPHGIAKNAAVRKEVAAAIIKAACSVKSAEITPDKVVVRFGEFAQRFGR
eukprot:1897512-Rhodomonas_salina.8